MRNLLCFIDTFRDLTKTKDPDVPVAWNCCDEMVAPKDLAQHYKENHLRDGRGPTREQCVDLFFEVVFFLSIMFIHVLKNPV